jgi:hypothetical protein
VLVERQDGPHVLHGSIKPPGHLLEGGVAVARCLQLTLGTQHLVQLLDHVHRQADGARLVHDGPLDVLADPPGGVGGKAEAALGIELFEGVDESQIALLDEVEQGMPG